MYDKDRAELQRLQITRKRDERIAAEAAAKAAKSQPTEAPQKNGFDFSTRQSGPSSTAATVPQHSNSNGTGAGATA
jgi:hypothetical protein